MDISNYKGVYVFAEQRRGTIQKVTFELLGKARELADNLQESVVAILLGKDITDKAQELIEAGADKVLVVDNELLKEYMTEPYAQAVSQIINQELPGILMIGATTIGRDLGPRVSARCNTGLTADCTILEIGEKRELLMTRPAFGGNLMATILCKNHRPQMSTVRPGVMRRLPADPNRKGEIINYDITFDTNKINRVRLIENVVDNKDSVDIADSNILISAGRAMAKNGGIDKAQALAKEIGGVVSGSRAIVDAGMMSHDNQVGQTGKTVRPDVYLACCISGAIQHIAGMEESDLIIAINRDKFAPIFNIADLGIVGDAHQILPMLTERIQAIKAQK